MTWTFNQWKSYEGIAVKDLTGNSIRTWISIGGDLAEERSDMNILRMTQELEKRRKRIEVMRKRMNETYKVKRENENLKVWEKWINLLRSYGKESRKLWTNSSKVQNIRRKIQANSTIKERDVLKMTRRRTINLRMSKNL